MLSRPDNSKDEVLFTNKWTEVRKKDGWHVYSHARWINGIAVAVLGFRRLHSGKDYFEYLGRFENIPTHSPEPILCSITGGYDNGHKYSLVECALNELREEGGYDAPIEAVMNLGQVFPSKSSDTIQHIYAVDLDHPGVKPCDATTDGTRGEFGSYAKWVSEDDIIYSSDPLNHTMLLRLQRALREEHGLG
jgi:hypothetical protein